MSIYNDIPERGLEPPEPDFEYCKECQGEVYEGGILYCWEGKWICKDCLLEKVQMLINQEDIATIADVFMCSSREVRGWLTV